MFIFLYLFFQYAPFLMYLGNLKKESILLIHVGEMHNLISIHNNGERLCQFTIL